MIYQSLNEAQVLENWGPVITEATGIESRDKIKWMSKLLAYHEINESVYNTVHLNPNMNVPPMGPVTLPGNPGLTTQFGSQTAGSGDKPYSLLNIAMQVAAVTIALDLLPVIPMPGPMGILTYLDFVYAGGKLDSREPALYVQLNLDYESGESIASFTENAVYYLTANNTTPVYSLTFYGKDRIGGSPIFKVNAFENNAGTTYRAANGTTATLSIADTIATQGRIYTRSGASTGDLVATLTTGDAQLVRGLQNHITSFSGAGSSSNDSSIAGGNNVNSNEPFLRGDGESTPAQLMGLTLFNKSVAAQTYQVAAAVTQEQLSDLKQFGIDAMAQVEAVLVNELAQSINKLILEKMYRLGVTNAKKIYDYEGSAFNLVLSTSAGTTNVTIGRDTAGNVVTIPTPNSSVGAAGFAENEGTLQRRILTKILAAASIIAIRGRRGPANFAVVNGQIATALQSIAGFQPYPISNTFNQNSGSLMPVGSISGIMVYTDPNMDWSDTRVLVGRKGDGNSPGLVFMPYLMAESVQTITQETMAPKIMVKSRFALVEAGFHPETMYLTIKIDFGSVMPIV